MFMYLCLQCNACVLNSAQFLQCLSCAVAHVAHVKAALCADEYPDSLSLTHTHAYTPDPHNSLFTLDSEVEHSDDSQ